MTIASETYKPAVPGLVKRRDVISTAITTATDRQRLSSPASPPKENTMTDDLAAALARAERAEAELAKLRQQNVARPTDRSDFYRRTSAMHVLPSPQGRDRPREESRPDHPGTARRGARRHDAGPARSSTKGGHP